MEVNKSIKVSVVMATYNGEKFLKEQIESILNQTFPIYEIIIQDDCSQDTTPEICREYAARYANIHFFENKHNLGFNRNFKTAVKRASGDFVAISDQDDIWFTTKIEKLVENIGNHDICFSAHTRGTDPDNAYVVRPQYSFESLLFQGFAGHTTLMRRDFIQNDDNWLPFIFYDWSLEICAILNNGITYVDEPLNFHRINENSACATLGRKYQKSNRKSSPTYESYLYGWSDYRKIQKDPDWEPLYEFIFKKTSGIPKWNRVHKMAKCMLSHNPLAFLNLCFICMLHKDIIYPQKGQKGIKGLIHGFFYPFIFAYNNNQYKFKL